MTINDEELLFIPFEQPVSLSVPSSGYVNLLLDNNQPGFIELVVKKCDQSEPTIAYAFSPTNFMEKNYDYESTGSS